MTAGYMTYVERQRSNVMTKMIRQMVCMAMALVKIMRIEKHGFPRGTRSRAHTGVEACAINETESMSSIIDWPCDKW